MTVLVKAAAIYQTRPRQKHINMLSENVKFLNVEGAGTYSYHSALNGDTW
jgi:hypothetical protein